MTYAVDSGRAQTGPARTLENRVSPPCGPSAPGIRAGGDVFRITGPAVVSFSGGRTSAYMLWRILQAHGGRLPDDMRVVFANTGREMPATLDFVRDCGAAWNVPIVWMEFTACRKDGYQIVNHNSASRDGPIILYTRAQVVARRALWAKMGAAMVVCTVAAGGYTAARHAPASWLGIPPTAQAPHPVPIWRGLSPGLPVQRVPEPASALVLGVGLVGLWWRRRV